MEYGCYFTIFGLKMIVKSGVEKIFLKFLYAQDILNNSLYVLHKQEGFLHKVTNSVTKITLVESDGYLNIFKRDEHDLRIIFDKRLKF